MSWVYSGSNWLFVVNASFNRLISNLFCSTMLNPPPICLQRERFSPVLHLVFGYELHPDPTKHPASNLRLFGSAPSPARACGPGPRRGGRPSPGPGAPGTRRTAAAGPRADCCRTYTRLGGTLLINSWVGLAFVLVFEGQPRATPQLLRGALFSETNPERSFW